MKNKIIELIDEKESELQEEIVNLLFENAHLLMYSDDHDEVADMIILKIKDVLSDAT